MLPAFLELDLGREGIVAKRADGPYRSGRVATWITVRCIRRMALPSFALDRNAAMSKMPSRHAFIARDGYGLTPQDHRRTVAAEPRHDGRGDRITSDLLNE